MLVWFAAFALVIVAQVFASPAVDHRVVVLGAVLPVGEGFLGGPYLLHTLSGPVLLLAVVMMGTAGRRLVRRRWLGLPIGVFLHLLLDGTWTDGDRFWWPFGGGTLGQGQIPEWENLPVSLVLEGVGIAVAIWAWRRYGLGDPARRSLLLKTGRLSRDLM